MRTGLDEEILLKKYVPHNRNQFVFLFMHQRKKK